MESFPQRIRFHAVVSRVVLVLVSILSNWLVLDHVPDAFSSPEVEELPSLTVLDQIVETCFGGLHRWDSEHFVHIALSRYVFVTDFAFFPGFPLLMKVISWPLTFLGLNAKNAFILAAVIFNNWIFVKTAVVLYDLSHSVLLDARLAYNAALFFIWTPANVFFIAPYSESLFCFLSFSGMLAVTYGDTWEATAWFTAATLTRSNGITLCGFIAHHVFTRINFELTRGAQPILRHMIIRMTFILCTQCMIIILPFVVFQLYTWISICHTDSSGVSFTIIRYAMVNDIPLIGQWDVFCSTIQIPYFYIQRKFWGVGFLKYFMRKQIPNFLIASPVVSIMLAYGAPALKKHFHAVFDTAPLLDSRRQRRSDSLNVHTVIFLGHALYLTVYCFFFINVQVTTRLIASSSPVLYWIAATQLVHPVFGLPVTKLRPKGRVKTDGLVIAGYFLMYSFLGVVLFSNAFPWT